MSTEFLVVASILIGGYFALAYFKKLFPFKKPKVTGTPHLSVDLPESFPYYNYTPKGVNCMFYKPITDAMWERIAPVIDMGISNMIRALPEGWTRKRTHGEFNIIFIEPHTTNQDGTPALLIRAGGQRYQTAGTVLGVGKEPPNFRPPTLILPFQEEWNFLVYLMYSVWNEAEHDAEWANDWHEFRRWAHSGDVHQHRPLPPDQVEMPVDPDRPAALLNRAVRPACALFQDLDR